MHYVTVADAKASGLLVLNLALITLLIEHQIHLNTILCWIAIIGYFLSSIISICVIFPRLPSGGDGLIFWEDILTRNNPEQYSHEFLKIDIENLISESAKQNWYVSSVLHKKYKITRYSIVVFLTATLLSLLSVWS
jgi:hypothetical protein